MGFKIWLPKSGKYFETPAKKGNKPSARRVEYFATVQAARAKVKRLGERGKGARIVHVTEKNKKANKPRKAAKGMRSGSKRTGKGRGRGKKKGMKAHKKHRRISKNEYRFSGRSGGFF